MQDPGPSFQQHFDFSSPSAFSQHFPHCGDNTVAPTDTSPSSSSAYPLSAGIDGMHKGDYSPFDVAAAAAQLGQHNAFQSQHLTSSPSNMEGDISPASSSTSPVRPRFDMNSTVSDLHTFASSGLPASHMGGPGSWSSTPATSATDAGGSPSSCAGGMVGVAMGAGQSSAAGADGAVGQSIEGDDAIGSGISSSQSQQDETSSQPAGASSSGTTQQKSASSVKSSDASDQAAAADKKMQAKFVYKVYSMCEDPDCQHLIAWSESGTSVFIHNFEEFSKDVLGKHFKHSNFSSFIRQLNMYGFYKVNKSNKGAKGTAEAAVWEFSHPRFIRGRVDLLDGIRRKVFDAEPPAERSSRARDAAERASYSLGDQESQYVSGPSAGHSTMGAPAPTVYAGSQPNPTADISSPAQLIASQKALRLQVDGLQRALEHLAHYTQQLGDSFTQVVDHLRRTSAASNRDGVPTFDVQLPSAAFSAARFSHSHLQSGVPFSPLQPVFTSPTPTFTSSQHPPPHHEPVYAGQRQRFDSRPEIYVTEPPLGLGHPHPSESSGWSSTTPTGPSGAYMTRDTRRSNSTPGPMSQGTFRVKSENGDGGMPNALTIDTQYANIGAGSGRLSSGQNVNPGARPGGLQNRSASMYSTLQSGGASSQQMMMAINTPLPTSPAMSDFNPTGLPGYDGNGSTGVLYGTSPESFDSTMRLSPNAGSSTGGGSGTGTPNFLTTSPFMASFPGNVSPSDLGPGVSEFGVPSNGSGSFTGSSRGSKSSGRGSVSRGATSSSSSQERPAPYPQQHSSGKVPLSPGGGVKRKSPGV